MGGLVVAARQCERSGPLARFVQVVEEALR
jgi:hypothetical protein